MRGKKYLTEEARKEALYQNRLRYKQKNPEKIRAARKRWRVKHAEEIKKHKQKYYLENRTEWQRKRKQRVFQLKMEIIKHYTKGRMCCANCGLRDVKNLTVDHINGNGEKHRKTMKLSGGHSFYLWLRDLNFPPGFQILCFACNMAKGGKTLY